MAQIHEILPETRTLQIKIGNAEDPVMLRVEYNVLAWDMMLQARLRSMTDAAMIVALVTDWDLQWSVQQQRKYDAIALAAVGEDPGREGTNANWVADLERPEVGAKVPISLDAMVLLPRAIIERIAFELGQDVIDLGKGRRSS